MKSIVGVDISQVSVDRYNAQAARLGFSPEKMRAVCVELKGEPGELDGAKFDAVIVSPSFFLSLFPCLSCPFRWSVSTLTNASKCCASYHHFASIDDITRALAALLKPGGSLLVSDIKAEADDRELIPAAHHGMVPHAHGIDEARLRATFEGAGLGWFGMKDAATHLSPEGKEITWFIARGVKPSE